MAETERRLRNTEEESAFLTVCDSAVQSWGGGGGGRERESWKKAQKHSFLVCFSAVLGIRRRGCDDDRRGRAELTGQLVPASTPTPYPRSMCTPRT